MTFELTMRLFFGEKAYHIASQESYPKSRREWLSKAVKGMLRLSNDLDTTPRHKQMIMSDLEHIYTSLKTTKENTPSWELVYFLFRLCFRFLGFDYIKGARCHTPAYWQTTNQNVTSVILEGGDVMHDYYEQKDAISIRKKLVSDLKAQGTTDFKIALVLNTSEYEVKKLRKSA